MVWSIVICVRSFKYEGSIWLLILVFYICLELVRFMRWSFDLCIVFFFILYVRMCVVNM